MQFSQDILYLHILLPCTTIVTVIAMAIYVLVHFFSACVKRLLRRRRRRDARRI